MELTRPCNMISIIGGGAGGCFTALELAKTGQFRVYLFEKNQDLMTESSNVSPGRMGLGFHYADPNTAIYHLHTTLEFTKIYRDFKQERGRPLSHPLRRGRYFIMKNSVVPKKDILKTFAALKEEYTRMVKKDKSYQVFGPPENFYQILQPNEYSRDVAIGNIEVGIETAEELLDWTRLRKHVLRELYNYQKKNLIVIKTGSEVIDICAKENGTYEIEIAISSNPGLRRLKYTANTVVNASWYNIPKFNKMLGVSDRKRCNRIKAIVTVRLPNSLLNAPCMFFCMGPFCMFSNKGNGIGMMTYAPETNIAVSSSADLENEWSDIYFSKPSDHKAQNIIDGVSQFIPDMKNAELVRIDYGVVQTMMDKDTHDKGYQVGDLDYIHDPVYGGIYKRDYSGVKILRPGYIVNACMKLMYCQRNAQLVTELVLNNNL